MNSNAMNLYEIYGNVATNILESNKKDNGLRNQSIHELHCVKCYSIISCPFSLNSAAKVCDDSRALNLKRSDRLGNKTSKIDISSFGGQRCELIRCPHKCQRIFHACKLGEHELLCEKMKVPCINSEYGCPFLIERKMRSEHLETCPASVVVCTMEWNRWPMPSNETLRFPKDESQLDISLTARDENMISQWKKVLPHSLRCTLRNYMNTRHPAMPLGVSGNKISRTVIERGQKEKEYLNNIGVNLSESEESDYEDHSDYPWNPNKRHAGLLRNVCNKLKQTTITDNENFESRARKEHHVENGKAANQIQESQPLMSQVRENEQKCRKVHLSLTVNVMTKCYIKPEPIYTFICAREFRRDEFPTHFREVHSKIHSQLNGWLFTRCPFANKGCSHGFQRIFPKDEEHRVVYHSEFDAFAVTQALPPSDIRLQRGEKCLSLTDLPFEMLLHLSNYLDPLSLNSLSMTCVKLRELCEYVVLDRGIVILHWEKSDKFKSLGWVVEDKRWMFSSAFSPVKDWRLESVGKMASHMAHCPQNDRVVHTKPFRICDTPERLGEL